MGQCVNCVKYNCCVGEILSCMLCMTSISLTMSFFCISVAEEEGKTDTSTEGMEISTRSKGKNILYYLYCLYIGQQSYISIPGSIPMK